MQKIMIKFKRVVVKSTDQKKGKFDLAFFYDENGKPSEIETSCMFDEASDDFAARIIREVKQKAQGRFANADEDDFLSGYVNVLIEEREDGFEQEKITNAIRKFKEKVKNMRSLQFSRDYVQRFQELSSGFEADL